jgi:Transglutaminase-like superfamily
MSCRSTSAYLASLLSVFLLGELALAGEVFKPGPLSAERLTQAAEAAGFVVQKVTADIPHADHSKIPFTTYRYDDDLMVKTRAKYHLEDIIADAPDEWTAQLRLKQWVHERIRNGEPRVSARHAIDILDFAARGESFYCTHYAIAYSECAQALGWQARKIAVDREHGADGLASTHHGVAEVWSDQFCKWVVIDPQSNLHFERRGLPLSAWEVRAEWLKHHGADVDHVVGVPPHTATKNPAIIWWNRKDEDETATYFWFFVSADATIGTDLETCKFILPQDTENLHKIWYDTDDHLHSRLHPGYTKHLFLPTSRIEDAYWTVCVVEAFAKDVSAGSIQLSLESYCPNRTGYEASLDGTDWKEVKDPTSMTWNLHTGQNSLRLRTASRGNVRGSETRLLLLVD